MESSSPSVPFPLLKDPARYTPCTIKYFDPAAGDDYTKPTKVSTMWIEVFRKSIPSFRARAAADSSVNDAEERAEKFAQRYGEMLDDLDRNPLRHGGPFDCLMLCRLRDLVLRELGFEDIFKTVKGEENESALKLLPSLLEEIDLINDGVQRLERLIKGVFAGNIFDLGAAKTADLFEKGQTNFKQVLGKLVPRPWVIDDLDRLKQRCASGPRYKKAVMFVDNAGADALLGMVPLAREFVKRGTKVVLAANEVPSINDITCYELRDALSQIDDDDIVLALDSGSLCVVSSGSDLPVIDLLNVSPELAWAADDADLVVLEGMGRAIETNLYAEFKCDSLCLGMVKHPEVAEFLGGTLYDCVCKFTEGH
ncbi:hypothetical protein CBR_g36866 [Chara braunii]|uniref:Damage-control phosphatase ARMT1-like metal-binding domain-containing protein n=1 Tax=Chara braunii TaxID=69332 RepID=A0A388LLW3_CHABU|nr:hypothetical protein CBR_g36866 [Chara braunii]|eukprot:GBG83251.1 hypothetical protein CBR_g36866 [Chara braunii]